MYRKLKVYAGDRHPHQAQKPVAFSLNSENSSSRKSERH
jgi:ribosomal protein L13